ncbi:MAG: translation initiation factor [Candidatus Omnitrophica bacterium]|nr:translation initiation factor [Candidatus Omnitrophota bacterium]
MIHIPDTFLPRDENGQIICPKCKLPTNKCQCPSYDPTQPKTERYSPTIKLEKAGRSGKIVSVIQHLPNDEAYLKRLIKIIKTRTASGGTFYILDAEGVIEIQGNHQAIIEKILGDENFSV